MSEATTPEEREELRATVRALLEAKSSEEHVRRAMESERGYDEALWTQMADQVGLQGLAFPAEHGGDGYGFAELGVVLEELGRALTPSPFLPTVVLAGTALTASGDTAAQAAHLPGIAAGKTTATLAVAEGDGLWDTGSLTTTATRDGAGWTLTGRKWFVLNGATADLILVVAQADEGPSLFAITGDAPGLVRTPLRTLDLTRPLARLDLTAVPAAPVGEPGSAAAIVARVLDHGTTALAAEQVGGALACLKASVAYARERVQFGRPIGSFQAVKHKCADMLVRVQLADAAAHEAADALTGAEDAPDPAVAAAVAHVVCSEAFMFVAMENIQVHGGIGFTWEHPAHLYFRRAKSSQLLFGGPAVYHERLLSRMGL
ncbi:acyl-CoA dehydrogenase family protein [Actinomadura sp. SCN-SB]|uniref:acyl-CoA dehydrogenase family protein n=1 Tax=Actinomadura sp. SCN-SB TaxID=3373092 RepID=UPI0037511AAB